MDRLKELREEKKVSQKEIANLLNISQQFYSRYEMGEVTMPMEKYKILADFYETSTDYIIYRTDERKPYPKRKNNE